MCIIPILHGHRYVQRNHCSMLKQQFMEGLSRVFGGLGQKIHLATLSVQATHHLVSNRCSSFCRVLGSELLPWWGSCQSCCCFSQEPMKCLATSGRGEQALSLEKKAEQEEKQRSGGKEKNRHRKKEAGAQQKRNPTPPGLT